MGRAEDLFERIRNDGVPAIERLVAEREFESLFLEFKTSADRGEARSLHKRDRAHLAKAISGFGNSEGGVVVWGIESEKTMDWATAQAPLADARKFRASLEDAISGCTLPPHPGVENQEIATHGSTASGFVAAYIPQAANPPLRVANEHLYYMRAGSTFHPVPHSVLAGMFGKRPQSQVSMGWAPGRHHYQQSAPANLTLAFEFIVQNTGRGMAERVYVSFTGRNSDSEHLPCEFGAPSDHWMVLDAGRAANTSLSLIAPSEVVLAPQNSLRAARVVLHIPVGAWAGFYLVGVVGSADSPAAPFQLGLDPEAVAKLVLEAQMAPEDTFPAVMNRLLHENLHCTGLTALPHQ
jgi:hypothetical protein